jgi:hypothetical protein
MKKLLLIICASLFLSACGGSGTSKDGAGSKPSFEAKVNGQDVLKGVKSSWQVTKEVGTPTTAMHVFVIRNFDYDANAKYSVLFDDDKLKEAGQAYVIFTIYDEKDKSNAKTPLKVGTYSGKSESNNSFGQFSIVTFGDGSRNNYNIIHMGQPNNKGEVKITSVTDDTVTGEIDASGKDGDKEVSVKGAFTAKIYKPKS